jgi:hypothetical protein
MNALSNNPHAVYMRSLKASDDSYRLRDVYYGIIKRCYSPRCKNYCIYGGRGVRVCDQWRYSFSTFEQWARENGWKHGLQIDRVDCDGDYEPSNCRFVTSRENNRNRRNNKLNVESVAEIRRLLAEGFSGCKLARMFSVDRSLIYRIKLNKQWV